MSILEHHIDPDADAVIVLRNPCLEFAPWQDGTSEATTSDAAGAPADSVPDSIIEAGPKETEISVLYYVSSRHLTTASPWFRRALTKEKWTESGKDEKDGLVHIHADDWDSEAFLILMNIIHLKNRKVPREVSLEDLAKFAVIVDYYECAEAVEHFTDKWKESLRTATPIPSTHCRALILWICIAWVFEWEEQFSDSTLVAVKQCSEPLRTLGLPIPERVTEQIDLKRYEAMEHVIESLHGLREKYLDLDYACTQDPDYSFNCGSTLYGAISKEMLAIQILSPRPQIPFTGMSFEGVCAGVRNFRSSSNNNGYRLGYYNDYRHTQAHSCSLTTAVTEVIDNVVSTVGGFQLQPLKER
ncbi:hypothetical protein P171DRAFT_392839 [Karstenula rhodostoma CBS 690.94]|uniref:BTB domain-containing protein n=1 Tax=Karstenula rhodostoma CBS 690.94 TaxID=1392251 RepID=A0A9P4PEJ1_9PLEO|nr:hypothetical protein P171DRAFT_392839 [Karstenula rhodostoma CBS 690.94]